MLYVIFGLKFHIMFIMYMYIICITIYDIHIHDLPKFEPKTLWRHPNAFAIKLHNILLPKDVQFLKNLFNFKIIRKFQIETPF
jgi:hypothetical protein